MRTCSQQKQPNALICSQRPVSETLLSVAHILLDLPELLHFTAGLFRPGFGDQVDGKYSEKNLSIADNCM